MPASSASGTQAGADPGATRLERLIAPVTLLALGLLHGAQGRAGLAVAALGLAGLTLLLGQAGASGRRAHGLFGRLALIGLGLFTLLRVGPASANLLLCLAVAAPRGPAPGRHERGLLVLTALAAAALDLWTLATGAPAASAVLDPLVADPGVLRFLNLLGATVWLATAWKRMPASATAVSEPPDAVDGAIVSPVGFKARARDEMARRRRHGQALSLLVAELDPVEGQAEAASAARQAHLLRMLARTVRDIDTVAAGPDDATARVLLPHTDTYGALALAERVRVAVGRSTWQEGHRPLRLTVTVGTSTLRPGETFDDAMERAVAALRAGQRDGHNRVRGETGMADLLV